MFEQMKEDVQVVFERDPAAKTKIEVMLNYPGLHAIWIQRGITHKLLQKKHFAWRGLSLRLPVSLHRWKSIPAPGWDGGCLLTMAPAW